MWKLTIYITFFLSFFTWSCSNQPEKEVNEQVKLRFQRLSMLPL